MYLMTILGHDNAKRGIETWDIQGTIWDEFYNKYHKSITDNPE
jgi:hypothetical protein